MQTRRLGRTEHHSSVAILGAAAFWDTTPDKVVEAFALADAAGVNHLDIAPQYGKAQQLAGQVLPAYRDRWFVGCKTLMRDRDGSRAQLEESLSLLQTDYFDLYQLHAVTSEDELSAALAPGGAVETLVAARDEGIVRAIGMTGHYQLVPRLFLQALERVDLDTVMLPVNAPMLAVPGYRADLDRVFAAAAERDLGVMAIKAVARSPWRDAPHDATTWYRPHRSPDAIADAVRFTLSLPVTAFATAGDLDLLPTVLAAAAEFTPLPADEIEARVAAASADDALVVAG
jgi:aryl-alcohol dehydrogenase-like predicted oxidoreductase